MISDFGTNLLYYISLPGTTWSNGLNYTRAKLKLIKNVDLFQMFELDTRRGVSGVFGNLYNESDDNHVILYVDQNNLNGYAMSQHPPTGNFQIYEKNTITESFIDKILSTNDCSNFG